MPHEIVPDHGDDGEAWVRDVDDPDIRGCGASRFDAGPWTWQVFVDLAEFVREEPLESEMRAGVDTALRSVPGVTEVAEEDREVWIVQGDPDGRSLVAAVGAFLDTIADRARAHLDEL